MLVTADIGPLSISHADLKTNFQGDTVSQNPVVLAHGDTIECKSPAAKYTWYHNDAEIKEAKSPALKCTEKGSYFLEITAADGKTSRTETIVMKKGPLVKRGILPSPIAMVKSFGELHTEDALVRNTAYSVALNFAGYMEAIALALLLGFLIGLVPFFGSFLGRYVDAIRFLPLTAVTGLFIAWFGIETNMKVQFLAFGIFVYLLPVVVQRIKEVEKTYLQTAYTLGASSWQTIRTVFWPSVTSRIFDDIRVLTAISWTYIIVAEMINRTGGVGSMIWLAARQSRLDKVFAILFVIIIIGIIQDKLFQWLDKLLFPYKRA
jgi:NitT/TauT family transport system permease protein